MPDPSSSELVGGPHDGAFIDMRPDIGIALTLDIGDGKQHVYTLAPCLGIPARLVYVKTLYPEKKPRKATKLKGGL